MISPKRADDPYLILGVGSQIALVAVVVGLAMMAQYGVLPGIS